MSKITEFLKSRGKELKPLKKKVDSKKLTAKQRNDLIDQMLKDLGYTE
jgi:ribonuclease HII